MTERERNQRIQAAARDYLSRQDRFDEITPADLAQRYGIVDHELAVVQAYRRLCRQGLRRAG